MDYVSYFFNEMKGILSWLWDGVVVRLFDYSSPLGISLLLGLIFCFVIFRYIVMPFMR